MHCGEESTNNNSGIEKETLLTPHIASHKSNTSVINIPFINDNQSPRLIAIPSNAVYKLNTSSMLTANVDLPFSIKSPNAIMGTLPEDLSAASGKAAVLSSEASTKPLPIIQPILNQAIDCFTGSLIVSDRNPTFYSFSDGTTVAITGQHPAVFVSSMNSDANNEVYRNRLDSSSVPSGAINTPSIESSASHNDISTLSFQQPGIHEGQLIVPEILAGQIIWDEEQDTKKVKNEDETEHKDLVRQALQAAVSHGSLRIENEDLLAHDYGSHECVSEDGICHSTFSVQNKPHEVLMMSGHADQLQNNGKYIGAVSTFLPTDIPNGAQVLVLQTATVADTANGPTVDLSSRRKRPKEIVPPRRKNVANRMKEKRANESEDQRKKRRSREAERMRKKRLQEDESTKQMRRNEAADRARKRRANLTACERDLERKKAAQRMRVRRLKEDENERKVRRDRAAERMRFRRSQETPEEKVFRRQGIAVKGRGKRKKEVASGESRDYGNGECVKPECSDPLAITPPNFAAVSDSPSSFHNKKDNRIKSVSASKLFEPCDQSLHNPSSNFTLLSNVLHNEAKYVPLVDFPEGIPVEVRTTESQRIPSMSISPPQHITVNKRIVTQAPPSYSESVASDVQNEPLSLQKSSGAQIGIHHLPHLLHQQHISSYPVENPYQPDQMTHLKDH